MNETIVLNTELFNQGLYLKDAIHSILTGLLDNPKACASCKLPEVQQFNK